MIDWTKLISDARAERTESIASTLSDGIMKTHTGDTMDTYNVSASIHLIVQAESAADAEAIVRDDIDKRIADGTLNAYRDFLFTVNYGIDWD